MSDSNLLVLKTVGSLTNIDDKRGIVIVDMRTLAIAFDRLYSSSFCFQGMTAKIEVELQECKDPYAAHPEFVSIVTTFLEFNRINENGRLIWVYSGHVKS